MEEHGERSLFLAPAPEPAPPAPAEPPAGAAAPLTVVEGGRRRRLQVLVVLALLVAGLVANRSNAERVDEPGGDDGRPEEEAVVKPPLIAPSLRTTARLGPLLPQLTGTTLLLGAGTQLLVLDVDTGTLRNVQVADLEIRPSYPWGSPILAVGDAVVARSQPPRAMVVPRTDGGPVADLDAGSGGGLYPSTEPGRFWVEELRGDPVLEEVDLAGEVSRTVPVPLGSTSIVWDGTGFLQTVDGTALSFGVDGGDPVPVGDGTVVAAGAATVALLRCQGADVACSLDLLDRATGAVRTVPPTADAPGFSAGHASEVPVVLSPDGRWLVIQSAPPAGGPEPDEPGTALVDVAAGEVRTVEPSLGSGPPVGAFSPDGRWLFLASTTGSVSAEVRGIRLVDGARFPLDVELAVRASFGLALTAAPTTPADRGR